LILAQFTATFNDQAIHIVAVFFAVDLLVRFAQVPVFDEKGVVALVTACFITPFLLFSSLAGLLGDRYSKRSMIVFWKLAEVGMMALALVGLALPHLVAVDSPHLRTVAIAGASLVVGVVFLMGMHSTFFVPAKLGAMPEIMHPSVLSRANGLLEGSSFMAQILGTSVGGMLYALLKGEVIPGANPRLILGQEWLIGVVLLVLALIGTGTALLMSPLPAADPNLVVGWNWFRPLWKNIKTVLNSKPLTLSSTGIAFCVFMTLFLRQTLLLQGEMVKELNTAKAELAAAQAASAPAAPSPGVAVADEDAVIEEVEEVVPLRGWASPRLRQALQEPELRVALLFVLVGLGVGVGSLVAGFLSGHRVELGMVPIGGVLIVLSTLLPSITLEYRRLFGLCLFGIGFGAGFYLVPMYTLLQQRAPKESKGNVIAASNFINVSGGVISVLVFFAVAWLLDRVYGVHVSEAEAFGNVELLTQRIAGLESQFSVPRRLYLTATIFTLAALILLQRRLPDFALRALIWLKNRCHNRLRVEGLENLPLNGPVLLLTNCNQLPEVLDLTAALDRHARVLLVGSREETAPVSWIEKVALGTNTRRIVPQDAAAELSGVLDEGREVLRSGGMVAVNIEPDSEVSRHLVAELGLVPGTVWLPVCSSRSENPAGPAPRILIGEPMRGPSSLAEARSALAALAANCPVESAPILGTH
jgi:acyl-[acyl-carrier-protein]-phospholipid O-acyltransferase/long-chain-fatty-acid--[acyl-carrier-protein] ligase